MNNAPNKMNLGAVGVNTPAVVPSSLWYISVPAIVSVTSPIGLSIISVRSVGAGAGAAMKAAVLTLEFALATTCELVCMGFARLHGILEFLNQIVILVYILQVTEKVLGGVTKEADAVGFLVVGFGYLQYIVVFLGLLVSLDQSVEMARL